MGLLNFKYQKSIAAKEHFSEKIAENLRNNGIGVVENNGEISVDGLKSYFNVGSATVKVEDSAVRVEGKVKPSIAAMITCAVCVILTCIFLFMDLDSVDDVLGALVCGIFGVSGLLVSVVTFLVGKELLRQDLLLLVNGADK